MGPIDDGSVKLTGLAKFCSWLRVQKSNDSGFRWSGDDSATGLPMIRVAKVNALERYGMTRSQLQWVRT